MNNNAGFLHEERPQYQRENIDLAIVSITRLLGNLGIETSTYDPNNITYGVGLEKAGIYDVSNDTVRIDKRHTTNTKVHIHELTHAYASDYRYGQLFDGRYRTGFHIQNMNCYGDFESHNSGFNEGVTQLITLEILRQNLKDIKDYRMRLQTTMQGTHNDNGNYECRNTGWYKNYLQEMNFVNVLIDLVAFERSKKSGNPQEHRMLVWNDIVVSYFGGNFGILRSIVKEADSTGRLKKHIETLRPSDDFCQILVDDISSHIREIFQPSYEVIVIPETLQ